MLEQVLDYGVADALAALKSDIVLAMTEHRMPALVLLRFCDGYGVTRRCLQVLVLIVC